jgi:hypothetical protein
MLIPSTKYSHIEITQMLVRLYILLAQELDRCLDQNSAHSFPEPDFQAQLKSTRSETLGMLSVNRVVQEKVEHECARALALRTAFLQSATTGAAAATSDIRAERTMLKTKTLALTDLLAVFRSA